MEQLTKITSCYCRCEIQLKLRRIVHLRQWQSQERRKWLWPGGSLPTCRISTWDTPECRRSSKGSRRSARWIHRSASVTTLQCQTTAFENWNILLQIHTWWHKPTEQEFETHRAPNCYICISVVTSHSHTKHWWFQKIHLDNTVFKIRSSQTWDISDSQTSAWVISQMCCFYNWSPVLHCYDILVSSSFHCNQFGRYSTLFLAVLEIYSQQEILIFYCVKEPST